MILIREFTVEEKARRLLFLLIQQAYPHCCPEPMESELDERVWERLFELASQHGVLAIVHDAIERYKANDMSFTDKDMPRLLKLKWALNVERIEQRYAEQCQAIARMAKVLAPHGIRLMILKGYGLSLLYPRPEHRPCGDIDIWTFGRQKESDEVFHKEFGATINEDSHHHTVFFVDGVMVENHYDFLNIHSHRSNRIIEEELHRFAQEPAREVEIDGEKIYLPSANFNALFLLRHAAAHFAAREIGLRHVLDWAMFVRRNHRNIDWDQIFAIAKRANMHRFLNCMNAISMEYLSHGRYPLLPTTERDKELEERVLNDILCPEFSEEEPKNCGFIRRIAYRTRRWWCNRWKHRIVYSEGLFSTFIVQIYSHLLKPKTLR